MKEAIPVRELGRRPIREKLLNKVSALQANRFSDIGDIRNDCRAQTARYSVSYHLHSFLLAICATMNSKQPLRNACILIAFFVLVLLLMSCIPKTSPLPSLPQDATVLLLRDGSSIVFLGLAASDL